MGPTAAAAAGLRITMSMRTPTGSNGMAGSFGLDASKPAAWLVSDEQGLTTRSAECLLAPPRPHFQGITAPDGCTIATQSQVLPSCGLAERGAGKLPCG